MELVICNNGKATTTSIKVSDYFGKPHNDVLKAIRKLLDDAEIVGRGNFSQSSYTNDQNKLQPMYELDRDGFTLLAMGFTGKQALQFKLSYIDAFNKAEKALMTDTSSLTPQLQLAHAMLLAGNMIEEQKNQIEQRDKFISVIQPKAAIADRLVIADGLYNLTTAAKLMNCQPRQFNKDLNARGWIYRMGGKGAWVGYTVPTKSGLVDHKLHQFEHTDGTPDTSAQVFITVKGMHKLAGIYNVEFQEAA